MFAILLGLASAVPVAVDDGATRAAILATCHDNIDGQLQGDVVRVEGSLHPDVVMRAVATSSGHAPGALESETGNFMLRAPVPDPSTIEPSPTDTSGPVMTPGWAVSQARVAASQTLRSLVMTVSGQLASHDAAPGNDPGPSQTTVLPEQVTG